MGDFIFDGANNLVTEDGANRTLDKSPYDGNYTVTGADGDDNITMGGGNDTVNGMDGQDVISTGAGDDRIIYGEGDTLDGGTGFDTLVIEDDNLQLDLGSLDAMNIEMIDLGVETELSFTLQDIINFSDNDNMFVINGDANDGVTSLNQGWDYQGQDEFEGEMYNVYAVGQTNLLVQEDIIQDLSTI
jgi:hypothetical protein